MDKKQLLIVDDEEHICNLVSLYLSDEFHITKVYDGHTALSVFVEKKFDLIVLDIMLPGLNGWELCRRIRMLSDTPVIMLTAKDDPHDKILGFDLGADDYVTKPFNPGELLARAKAVLRRFNSASSEEPQIIKYPGFVLNKETFKVEILGQLLELTAKEFSLLWFFASNPGIVLQRENIMLKVWGFDYMGDTRTIDNTIKRLRRKLESVPEAPVYIQTVWGLGYKFEVDRNE
ncbi:two-component system response regulator [Desulfitobacterium hafniense]|uniref:Stage 0 sporulation protein A homolog n=1 Tax=Desulfitobacterium hafniense TaxID=49338 RepID=A0A0W1JMV8_DESHA|nr:response regulator transcription factor [Desulfitobacterium hafniense]KTE92447.1 two-component system response regulator [Desulfitobacterium hafniense]